MIQNARYVPDPRVLVRNSQHRIVILRAVVFAAESSDFFPALLGNDQQMAKIHAAQEQVRRPIWFQKGLRVTTFGIEKILVGVNNVRRLIAHLLRHIVQSERRQDSLGVEKSQILSLRQAGCLIPCVGKSERKSTRLNS